MESINPNDIMTLDMGQISYIAMKNGNTVLIDDSIPQKSNKENNVISGALGSSVPESTIKKDIKLEISTPSTFSFEGKKNINDFNNINDYKSNFKACSKISKNISFSFDGIKTNNKRSSKSSSSSSSNSNKTSVKESKTQSKINMPNLNNNENDNSKIEKNDKSNINTNLSIPIMNFSNNIDNTNNSNNALNRRKSRASRIFSVGTARKGKISINAVCTLNIKGEEKTSINLISQFNSIVDKLNADREKKPIYESNDNERTRNNTKYYEFYKDRSNCNIRKKELLKDNFLADGNNNLTNGINRRKANAYNNFNSKNSFDYNGTNFKNTIGMKTFCDSYSKSPGKISFTTYKNFRDSTYKCSSDLVLPSNKMTYFFK